jgi:hypothetical protein
MSETLTPESKEFIKKLARVNPSDIVNNIDWDAIQEFIILEELGVVNLVKEQERRHFVTVRHFEIGKPLYGKKHEYFGSFWFELNLPVRIGIFISMFKKIIVSMKMFYKKAAELIFKIHIVKK